MKTSLKFLIFNFLLVLVLVLGSGRVAWGQCTNGVRITQPIVIPNQIEPNVPINVSVTLTNTDPTNNCIGAAFELKFWLSGSATRTVVATSSATTINSNQTVTITFSNVNTSFPVGNYSASVFYQGGNVIVGNPVANSNKSFTIAIPTPTPNQPTFTYPIGATNPPPSSITFTWNKNNTSATYRLLVKRMGVSPIQTIFDQNVGDVSQYTVSGFVDSGVYLADIAADIGGVLSATNSTGFTVVSPTPICNLPNTIAIQANSGAGGNGIYEVGDNVVLTADFFPSTTYTWTGTAI